VELAAGDGIVTGRWECPPEAARVAVLRDGEPVASTDTAPPVNTPLFYAVYARRGEATSEPVCAGPVVLRPEPARVELAAGDGVVTGRWECPPEAARVAVLRDGVPVPADREGFTDRDVSNGVTHRYRVYAVYVDGVEEVETPGVLVSATPHALPDPVLAFDVEPYAQDRLLLRFPLPRHGLVEALLLDREPAWPPGALVPLDELPAHRVESTPHAHGLVVQPRASGVLTVVTIAGSSAAIGASRRHVDLPAPSALTAVRRGGEVEVGFGWPGDAASVAVTYEVSGGPARRVSVSHAAYTAGGGVHLPVPEGAPVRISVAGTAEQGGTVLTGPSATAEVDALPVVRYDLSVAGPPWKRVLAVTLVPRQPVRLSRLELVVRDGRIMPREPAEGEPLEVWEDLDLPDETVLRVPMPRRPGPFWLRCFAGADVELADPPVRRLQQGT